jgi:ParB-like chromosome segregation protein Spo0J
MFNDAAIERIGRSIAKHGQLRPLCVITDVAADRYILIDGYLRLEACKRRGLNTVLAVCQSDEKQAIRRKQDIPFIESRSISAWGQGSFT